MLARLMVAAGVALISAATVLLLGCDFGDKPVAREEDYSSLPLLSPVPAFLDSDVTVYALGEADAFVVYDRKFEDDPLLAIDMFTSPVTLNREPEDTVHWVSLSREASRMSYDAIFRCGRFTLKAVAAWIAPVTADAADLKLQALSHALNSACGS